MNRSPAACAAGSFPSASGSAIDPETSTIIMMSSGVARPVHGVPIGWHKMADPSLAGSSHIPNG